MRKRRAAAQPRYGEAYVQQLRESVATVKQSVADLEAQIAAIEEMVETSDESVAMRDERGSIPDRRPPPPGTPVRDITPHPPVGPVAAQPAHKDKQAEYA